MCMNVSRTHMSHESIDMISDEFIHTIGCLGLIVVQRGNGM